jgi:hypothetical protein
MNYFTGTLSSINTQQTMLALLKWQLENKLVTDTTDPAA